MVATAEPRVTTKLVKHQVPTLTSDVYNWWEMGRKFYQSHGSMEIGVEKRIAEQAMMSPDTKKPDSTTIGCWTAYLEGINGLDYLPRHHWTHPEILDGREQAEKTIEKGKAATRGEVCEAGPEVIEATSASVMRDMRDGLFIITLTNGDLTMRGKVTELLFVEIN